MSSPGAIMTVNTGVVLAGIWMAIGYVGAGLLNCVTIIGIPFGIQSFKMAKLALWPFGSQIRSLYITSDHFAQHRRPSTAVLHISIEELRSEQAVTTAPSATKHVSFRLWQPQSGKAQKTEQSHYLPK